MKETKPTLFKLLICYFMLACFVVTILSILPYIMMKNDTILGDYSCGSGCDKCDYLGERLERK